MAPKPPSPRSKQTKTSSQKLSIPATDLRLYLSQSSAALQQGDAESATKLAEKAHNLSRHLGNGELACLTLLGEAHVEKGDLEAARHYFLRAVALDPEGKSNDPKVTHLKYEDAVLHGGGPETFLWLAQLSPDGGNEAVRWFEKGVEALRRQIEILENMPLPARTPERARMAQEKREKLCEALCAVAEVYMTDLSWEVDAEARCEVLVTEATMICPDSAEALQTLANVRISQERLEEARAALRRSLDVWHGKSEDGHDEQHAAGDKMPEFSTRVSLARLLIDVGMIDEAVTVLNWMQREDDQSVEVAYLGGWGRYTWGRNMRDEEKGGGSGKENEEQWKNQWRASRRWLTRCLKLFQATQYEDGQLGEHARELVDEITRVLGPMEDGEEDEVEAGEDGWEDIRDSDEEMT